MFGAGSFKYASAAPHFDSDVPSKKDKTIMVEPRASDAAPFTSVLTNSETETVLLRLNALILESHEKKEYHHLKASLDNYAEYLAIITKNHQKKLSYTTIYAWILSHHMPTIIAFAVSTHENDKHDDTLLDVVNALGNFFAYVVFTTSGDMPMLGNLSAYFSLVLDVGSQSKKKDISTYDGFKRFTSSLIQGNFISSPDVKADYAARVSPILMQDELVEFLRVCQHIAVHDYTAMDDMKRDVAMICDAHIHKYYEEGLIVLELWKTLNAFGFKDRGAFYKYMEDAFKLYRIPADPSNRNRMYYS